MGHLSTLNLRGVATVGTPLVVSAWIKFLFDHHFRFLFPPPLLFVAGAMGRRARNKQGDPLPLDADPDLNSSSKASRLKSKPGLEAKPSASNLNAKLGKRKPERDDEGRATKRFKEARSTGTSKPLAKASSAKKPTPKAKGKPVKPTRKEVDLEEDEVMDDDDSVGWEDIDRVDVRTEARCVCLSGDVDNSSQFEGHPPQIIVPRQRLYRRQRRR